MTVSSKLSGMFRNFHNSKAGIFGTPTFTAIQIELNHAANQLRNIFRHVAHEQNQFVKHSATLIFAWSNDFRTQMAVVGCKMAGYRIGKDIKYSCAVEKGTTALYVLNFIM